MNRRICKLMTGAGVLALAAMLCACGGKKKSDPDGADNPARREIPIVASQMTESKQPEEEKPKEKKTNAKNLEEYFASKEGKEDYDKIMEDTKAAAGEQKFEVKVTENKFTCTFIIEEVSMVDLSGEEKEQLQELMRGQLKKNEQTCQFLAASLEEMSGLEGISYEMAFVDGNGTVIYAREYTAQNSRTEQ